MTKLSLVAAILVISSCATHDTVAVRLPIPTQPILPVLRDSDLKCLSRDAYYSVARRDLAHTYYERRLESVIKSTWK